MSCYLDRYEHWRKADLLTDVNQFYQLFDACRVECDKLRSVGYLKNPSW